MTCHKDASQEMPASKQIQAHANVLFGLEFLENSQHIVGHAPSFRAISNGNSTSG